MYDRDPWPPIFAQADAVLWAVLHEAGVNLEAHELYGEFQNLFELYYARRESELSEPTTLIVLGELIKQKGFPVPDASLRAALRAMYTITQANWYTEEDAIPTIEKLRKNGYHIAYLSNGGDDENTQAVIDKGGLRPFAEFILSSAAFGIRKPHPSIFQAGLAHFGLRPEETVMVGDTLEADILGANQLGMKSIWITRRAHRDHDKEKLIRPDLTLATLREIPEHLAQPE